SAAMAHVHTKMWPGGLEVRRFTFWHLVYVKRMVPGRKGLDIPLDTNAVRRFGERGTSNPLTLGILKVDGYRLGCRHRMGLRHPAAPNQKTQTHQTPDHSHCPSLLSLDAPPRRPGRYFSLYRAEARGETRCSYSATPRVPARCWVLT